MFSFLYKKLSGSYFMGIMLALLISPLAVNACDDSVLLLLTADDPENIFCKSVLGMNGNISRLGDALSNRNSDQYQKRLGDLMEAWVDFSNRFSINPPEMARNDGKWREKLKDIGLRIGRIRKNIEEKQDKPAHDEAVELSSRLIGLFEAVKVPESKRKFLEGSELLSLANQHHERGRVKEMRQTLASFGVCLSSFTADLNPDLTPIRDRINMSLYALDAALQDVTSVPSLQTDSLLTSAVRDFQEFQNRTLAAEWFPNVRIKPASSALSPATIASSTNPGGTL